MKRAISTEIRASCLVLILGFVLDSTATVLAQQPNTPAPSRFCFRPKPSTGCDWFPITEFGVAVLRPANEGPTRIWNLGLARRVRERFALGATVAVTGADDFETTVTLSPTARVNLTRSVALSVAPGIVIHGRQSREFPLEQPSPGLRIASRAEGNAPAFALDASLGVHDWAALFFRTSVFIYSEVWRYPSTLTVLPEVGTTWLSEGPEIVAQEGVITNHWIGARASSYPGLGLGALAVVLTIIVKGTVEN